MLQTRLSWTESGQQFNTPKSAAEIVVVILTSTGSYQKRIFSITSIVAELCGRSKNIMKELSFKKSKIIATRYYVVIMHEYQASIMLSCHSDGAILSSSLNHSVELQIFASRAQMRWRNGIIRFAPITADRPVQIYQLVPTCRKIRFHASNYSGHSHTWRCSNVRDLVTILLQFLSATSPEILVMT